jgi:hypothetical protein
LLVLEVNMDIHFRTLFKKLGLVEETCPLLVLHWNCGVTTTVYDPDSIPVRLSIVCHKSFESYNNHALPKRHSSSSKVYFEQHHPLTACHKR